MFRLKLIARKKLNDLFVSRRAAFRQAKREGGIPVTIQPTDVVKPKTEKGDFYKLDNRNVRLYIFKIPYIGGILLEYHIREDKEVFYDNEGYQPKHFNAGVPLEDLDNHLYWIDNE